MRNRVTVECGGKLYRVTANSKCTARTCDLFKAGVCDSEDLSLTLPCDRVHDVLTRCGLCERLGCNFKEVAETCIDCHFCDRKGNL